MNQIKPLLGDDQQTATITTITPDEALAMLEAAGGHNFRTLRSPHARQLAHEMSAGKWCLNGEAIKFDRAGVLVDGQHRLKACVLSGVPLVTWVVRGVSREADLDLGIKRATHDALAAKGEANSRQLGAALGTLLTIEHPNHKIGQKGLSYRNEVLECLEKHPGVRRFVGATHSFSLFDHSTMFPALWYCFDSSDAARADVFMARLRDGVNVQQGSAVLLLRNQLLKMRTSKRKMDKQSTLATCIKAWNLYLQDRPVRYLAWRPSEPFPKIIGCTVFGRGYTQEGKQP